MDKKRVYTFGNGLAEGKAGMRNLLGGKGANLRASQLQLTFVPNITRWDRKRSYLS